MKALSHSIKPPCIIGLCSEVRCSCGVLLITWHTTTTSVLNVNDAFDQHLIGVLEAQWVKQFYQEA